MLHSLKFSLHEVKYKTTENKYKCHIHLGRYIWLILSNFKIANADQSNFIIYTKPQSESQKQVNYNL